MALDSRCRHRDVVGLVRLLAGAITERGSMRRALIVHGGWKGHQPREVAVVLAQSLGDRGLELQLSDTLEVFADRKALDKLDVVVLIWAMGSIEPDLLNALLAAIKDGTGFAGLHGTNFTFRDQAEYQYMIGGQWVAHPGGDSVPYRVNITDVPHSITAGLEDFAVTSEHYYMHVDPGNLVLATTRFGDVVMPVTWVKRYGQGRVFYCSLGHSAQTVSQPEVLEMVTRGIAWAAEKNPS
jgi:type 1 glutamine amidotransferase